MITVCSVPRRKPFLTTDKEAIVIATYRMKALADRKNRRMVIYQLNTSINKLDLRTTAVVKLDSTS